MIVINVCEEVRVPPFGYCYWRRNRNTHINELRHIIRSKVYDLRLRILFEYLRDHVGCIIIIQSSDDLSFESVC